MIGRVQWWGTTAAPLCAAAIETLSVAADVRLQSRLFARRSPRLRRSPNSKENERISTIAFLLSHFSPGDKIETCPAQFRAVCWIVRVDFKVLRLRDGFSVSIALVLKGSVFHVGKLDGFL
jgi:hypothetical protein